MTNIYNVELVDEFIKTYKTMYQSGKDVYAKRLLYIMAKAFISIDDDISLKHIYNNEELLEENINILHQLLDDNYYASSSKSQLLSKAIGTLSMIVRNRFHKYKEDINNLIIKNNMSAYGLTNEQLVYNDALLLSKELLVDRNIPIRKAKKMVATGITYDSMISYDLLYYYSAVTEYGCLVLPDENKQEKAEKRIIKYLNQLSLNKICDYYMVEDISTIIEKGQSILTLKLER